MTVKRNPVKSIRNDPLGSLMSLMAIPESKPHRNDAINDDVDGTEVDTCCCPDTEMWETGICRKGESWIIVAQYKNKAEAKKEHKKWVTKIKEDPSLNLVDVFYKDLEQETS